MRTLPWILGPMLAFSLACGGASLDGKVVDNFQKPVAGAKVEVTGSGFSTLAGSDGSYALDYAPGVFTVSAAAPGYLPASQNLNVAQKVPYKMADLVLTRLPKESAIHVAGPGDYALLLPQPVRVKKEEQTDGWGGTCVTKLVPDTAPILDAPDFLAFVPVEKGKEWKLLHAQDRVLSASGSGWGSSCPSARATVVKDLESTKVEGWTLLRGKLDPGQYCFVASDSSYVSIDDEPLPCFEWGKQAAPAPAG